MGLGTFLLLTNLLIGILVITLSYNDGKKTVRKLSNQLFGEISKKVFFLVKNHLDKASQLGRTNEKTARKFLSTDEELRHFLYDTLKEFPEFTYLGMGDERGTLIGADRISQTLKARQWVQVEKGRSQVTEYKEGQQSGKLIPIRQTPDTYDPRVRPWYIKAKNLKVPVWIDPYLWVPENVPGITFAIPSFNKKGQVSRIFTVDIQLDFINRALKDFYRYKSGSLFIVNEKGSLIAHNRLKITNIVQKGETSLPHIEKTNDRQSQFVFQQWKQSKKKKKLEYFFEGKRFLLKSRRLDISENISWFILMSVSEDEILEQALNSLYRSIGFSLLILVIIIVFCLIIGRHLTKSFNSAFKEMEEIFHFSLEQGPKMSSFIYEIDRISLYLSKIKSSLKSFKKYLTPILVKKYLLEGVEATLGGEEREVSVMFIDIENYTQISESLSTRELIQLLNQFSMTITKSIDEFHGTVDKFIGDSIMAFWGGLENSDDHALLACQCALKCCESMKNSNLNIRIGINTGKVIIGNFGSEDRFNFTVLGDNVNQASRLENTNKVYKTHVLIGETTFLQVKDKIRTRKIDNVILKGRAGVTTIYEILESDSNKTQQSIKEYYDKGLSEYQSQNWQEAISWFAKAISLANDGPSSVLKNRAEHYLKTPPPKDWDGVFAIETK